MPCFQLIRNLKTKIVSDASEAYYLDKTDVLLDNFEAEFFLN